MRCSHNNNSNIIFPISGTKEHMNIKFEQEKKKAKFSVPFVRGMNTLGRVSANYTKGDNILIAFQYTKSHWKWCLQKWCPH